MPNQVRHNQIVILNLALKPVQGLRFQNLIFEFDIPLAFAMNHVRFMISPELYVVQETPKFDIFNPSESSA